jgi:CBS domain-containing protein
MVFNIWKVGGLYEALPPVYLENKPVKAPGPVASVNPLEKDILQDPAKFHEAGSDPDQGRSSKYQSPASEIPTWRLQNDWVASQFMSFPVVTLELNTTLKEAWKVVIEKRYRHMPVVDEQGCLVGVVSDRDLLKTAARARKDPGSVIGSMAVSQIMKQPAVGAQGDTSLVHIALVFIRRRIGCMPITDAQGHVIGILTRTDLLRAMLGVKRDMVGSGD